MVDADFELPTDSAGQQWHLAQKMANSTDKSTRVGKSRWPDNDQECIRIEFGCIESSKPAIIEAPMHKWRLIEFIARLAK